MSSQCLSKAHRRELPGAPCTRPALPPGRLTPPRHGKVARRRTGIAGAGQYAHRQNRSDLQRVSYSLKDNQLIRNIWPTLDRAPSEEPQEMVLLKKVQHIEIRLLDEEGEWKQEWNDADNINTMPVAVEINVELEHWGVIKRLLQITGH